MPYSESMDQSRVTRRSHTEKRRRFFPSPVFLLFSFGLYLTVFWNVLIGDQQFAYRDESHFYYPIFQYIQTELEQGRFPLWTPYDNIGQPFFANAALGILYPGKLIFFLPFDYSILYNIYITGHVLIAAWTLYRLARYWGLGEWGATLGALSYGFAGTVLGQYCNPIFLVGAAWVPEAVHQGDRMLTHRSLRRALFCAAVLSIMLLGGDAQAAFQVGLALSLFALFRWFREGRLRKRSSFETVSAGRWHWLTFSKLIRNRAVLLGIVAGTTFVFSAVQILPSQEYARLCDRSGFKNPRSIWEIPRFLLAGDKDLVKDEILFDDSAVQTRRSADVARLTRGQRIVNGIFHLGKVDSHQSISYDFSEHPIQFSGYLWPGIEGMPFPQNSAWLGSITQFKAAANWFNSLYMGIVPFLLAVVSLQFRLARPRTNIRIVWLTWLLLICLWASMGVYGLGWFLQSLGLPSTLPILNFPITRAVGSGFWFLQTFIPGYIQFRYPAKLLTLAALPMAMLAAIGFERLVVSFQQATNDTEIRNSTVRRFRGLGVAVIVISVIFLIPASMRDQWFALAQRVPAGITNGPFVPRLARLHVLFALTQTILVLGAVWILFRYRSHFSAKAWTTAFLLIVSIDLYFAAKIIILVADRDDYLRDASVVWKQIRDDTKPEPVRILPRLSDLPRWKQEASPDRLEDYLIRFRQLAESQFHYALPRNKAGNLLFGKAEEWGTMVPYSYIEWSRRNIRNDYRFETNLMAISVEYVLMDANKPLVTDLATVVMGGGRSDTPPDWPENVVLWKLKSPRNRVWIERENGGASDAGESARIVHYEPDRVVIETELTQSGTAVLSDQYWPGWHVEVETLDKPGGETISKNAGTIRPIIGILRGVDLPAGAHRLTFRYAPDSFRNGALISAASWTLFVVFLFVVLAVDRRSSRFAAKTQAN